jgi:glycosyltransferase involved in cell wall biosynthesis
MIETIKKVAVQRLRILMITHHRRFKARLRSHALAKELVKRGHEVTLMVIADTRRNQIFEDTWDDVHVVETPDLLWGKLRSGWDIWDTFNRIWYLKDCRKFDLIHAFETRPATIFPVLYYLKHHRVPLVVDWIDWWGRGGLIYENRPWWYQKTFAWIETFFEEHYRPLAQSTTVISRALGERARTLGVDPSTIYWIPDGSDVYHFVPKDRCYYRGEFGIEQEKFVIGYSGVDVGNDADLLLYALKAVVSSHSETLLITTGMKSCRLDNLASTLGVKTYFRQFGFVPYGHLPKILSCVDLFVIPFRNKISNVGRWPHKIGDYMALGRPTVTNPTGEMKTLLSEENVGLLADETPEDMAAKILELCENEQLRMEIGMNARRVAESRFAWSHIADRLEQCYADTLHRFVN